MTTEETVAKTPSGPTQAQEGQRREAAPGQRREASAGQRREGGPRRRFPRRRKFCKFCADTSLKIDHKDPDMLSRMVTERYKIIPARVTGTCAKHQRALTTAIKRARILALMPFTPLHHD
jgi:small subunit ribosomal protein S18